MTIGVNIEQVRDWANDLGFQELAVTDTDLSDYSDEFHEWLQCQLHGDMTYMRRNVDKRLDPALLHTGTLRVLCVRMDYFPTAAPDTLVDKSMGYISRYALGRDYHKVIRRRLAKLAKKIQNAAGGHYRAFVDSAPVLEKPLAAKAGLGWVGKHTLVLNEHAGSFFFLGEIFTNIPFPLSDKTVSNSCGSCKACMTSCPTDAITAPARLDATRCISYLTIEHKGAIPMELRPLVGNRIFGCDDCQLVCPWNRFAPPTAEHDFQARHDLDRQRLADLLAWDEATFMTRTEGSAIRRISYVQWVRNLAVAAGNAPRDKELLAAVNAKIEEMRERGDEMCLDHLRWAKTRLTRGKDARDTDAVRRSTP